MYSSEFDERIKIITNYFRNEYKWKFNEYGDYTYYKGKRNLKELEFMVDLVLGDTMEVIKTNTFLLILIIEKLERN
ncbi:hypothetical protein AB0Y20_01275 [Heyndrickxia oleronia]|uniref:hypothetical protein n=1 Tax=Heyndrickxia oleronia TaxID=38875 RepID=UPI003F228C95